MSIFPSPSLSLCYNLSATLPWLVAVMVGLVLIGIALLVQVRMLWHRMTQMGIAWRWRLGLLLPLVWVSYCAFDVVLAFNSYRRLQAQAPLRGELPVRHLLCLPPPPLGGDAQVATIGAVCLLVLGWLALSAFARRIRSP